MEISEVQQLAVVTKKKKKNQKQKAKQVWMSGETQSTQVFYFSEKTGGEILSFCQHWYHG